MAETLHSHLAKLFETHMSKAPQNPSMWQEPGFGETNEYVQYQIHVYESYALMWFHL